MSYDKVLELFKKSLPVVLVILFTIPSYYQLIKPGFFPMQDDIQAFRIHQMDKCFIDLQIPCRWVPDGGFGYGYPLFEYYSPSIYYLGEIFHLIGFQFIDSVKILFILGFVFSALTMFVFLSALVGEYPGLIGSILYTYAPYRAVDVYVRGAMSEFWAFVFFPLIFWASYLLIQTNKIKYMAWLSLSIGLLLITHNLMSIIFLPVFGIWIIMLTLVFKRIKILPKVIFAGLIGIGFAAFFSLPVLFERNYAHLETLLGGYFDYRQHFVDLYQLFVSNHFGYGSSYLGPGDDLALTTGIVHWIFGLLAIVLAIKNFRKLRSLSVITLTLGVIEVFVLFFNHQKSSFIWDKIYVLSWLQFPWRILADSVFLLAILGAIDLYYLSFENETKISDFFRQVKKLNPTYVLGVVIIFVLFVLHLSFFQPKEWLNITDQDKFTGKSWDKQQTISIFDYLPIYAKYPPVTKAPTTPEVLSGRVDFINYQKGSNYQIGEVNVTEDARLRLPLFDYPTMKVTIDNKNTSFTHDDCTNEDFCLGLITFDISKGEHRFKAMLTNTPVREVGNILSVLSMIIIGYLFFKSLRHERNI